MIHNSHALWNIQHLLSVSRVSRASPVVWSSVYFNCCFIFIISLTKIIENHILAFCNPSKNWIINNNWMMGCNSGYCCCCCCCLFHIYFYPWHVLMNVAHARALTGICQIVKCVNAYALQYILFFSKVCVTCYKFTLELNKNAKNRRIIQFNGNCVDCQPIEWKITFLYLVFGGGKRKQFLHLKHFKNCFLAKSNYNDKNGIYDKCMVHTAYSVFTVSVQWKNNNREK